MLSVCSSLVLIECEMSGTRDSGAVFAAPSSVSERSDGKESGELIGAIRGSWTGS